MNAYNIGVIIGLIIGVVVGVGLLLLILIATTKNHKVKRDYDERQELVRGKGFKYGFITMAAANMVISCTQFIFYKPIADTWASMMLSLALGVLVHVHYCIWNEGYFSLNENKKVFMIIFAIMVLVQYAGAFDYLMNGGWIIDGMLTFRAVNLIAAIMITFILVDLLIKNAYAKKEDE